MKKSARPPADGSARRSSKPLPRWIPEAPPLHGQTASPTSCFERLEPRMLLSGSPYNGVAGVIGDGSRIEAEHYDLGGEGIGYSDTDTSNNGGAFRPSDGVDLQSTSDTGGGFNVGWTTDGEWLEYLVGATAGTYNISARVASGANNPGQLRLLIGDGNNFSELDTFDMFSTGGWQNWQTLTLNDIAIGQGPQILRAEVVGGGYNLNWLGFESAVMSDTTTAVQSGSWNDSSTWSHGVPDTDKRAIIAQGTTVTLDTDGIAEQIVIHGTLDVAELPGQTLDLTADWVHVNSGGVFQVGTATNRYDQGSFNLTLTGTDANADYTVETAMGSMQIMNNDGFLMAAGGGRLQFFGEEKLSFTKLSQTASVGSNSIVVENVIERNYDGTNSAASDGQLNWEVGDQIVIASSTRSYDDQAVRTITGVTDLGNGTTRLTLNAALTTRHYGEIELYDNGTRSIDLRAEVALLSRNVKVQGIASQDTDSAWGNRALFNSGNTGDHRGISGHIMIMPTAGQISVEGVQLDRLGQTGTLGRYPIHWHLAGDRTGDVLKGVSVTNSNNRGVTVHGTHNLLIQDVVLHDIHGHGFFMEDAVETGNQFLSNITFGIHQVGAVGDQVNLSDPFIVDTHDHVGQNFERFLSSAGYWMTNPANIWIGNISAGSEGTGFWFIFPDSAIGESAQDPQYANVRPDRTDLWTFDHNSSHSSPIGLNFDRGSDIEVPIGAQLKSNFDGDEHRPSAEPQINHYTAYKHTTGIYHRGRTANFHENRFADNFTSTFITFTQRITNALYVGHSQGNSDLSDIVTGHTFYDGANTLDDTHFAGFTANNAHTFRSHGAAQRLTHFVMSDTSFEADGTANNISFSNPQGFLSYDPVGKTMPSVIYDADGTFTSHVGGQAGSTIVPNNPFFYNDDDFLPAGWNARVSDDLYAMFRMREPVNNALFRVTSPDGFSGTARPGTGQFNGTNTLMKRDDGDYTVDFPEGLGVISNGFDIKYNTLVGPRDGSTMVRFVNVAQTVTPSGLTRVQNLATLRNTTGTAFATDGNDLWVKFSDNIEVDFVPGTNPPIEPPNENELLLSAVDDAYIQNTAALNDALLRIESSGRVRTSYLKFDVPDTPDKDIANATLRVTVTGDAGTNLRLRVFEGGSNNWNETNLSPANAPTKATLLDEITGNWVIGQTYEFDVSAAVSAGQEVTFVIDSDGSLSAGDAAFASSENGNTANRPALVLELEDAAPPSEVQIESLGTTGSGISVDDDATGTGFILFTRQNVYARFAASPPFQGSSS
ncbi:MAG: carbohydrate-binding domain-containing protein, partial [Planctomycetota bacterium]